MYASQPAAEKYLGVFISQHLFRTSIVFVTSERIVIRKTRHWIMSWGIAIVTAAPGPELTQLGWIDPTLGYALGIIIPIVVALGLQKLLTRRLRTIRKVEAGEHDIQFFRSRVTQIEITRFHGLHPARIRIRSLYGEEISLPFISDKVFKFASRLMAKFNPTAIKSMT